MRFQLLIEPFMLAVHSIQDRLAGIILLQHAYTTSALRGTEYLAGSIGRAGVSLTKPFASDRHELT
ncbi:hypothetical protein HED49_15450 [Ochrobactrum daejeonense]|nr:hypothetical protein [Brucella daejeonensis]